MGSKKCRCKSKPCRCHWKKKRESSSSSSSSCSSSSSSSSSSHKKMHCKPRKQQLAHASLYRPADTPPQIIDLTTGSSLITTAIDFTTAGPFNRAIPNVNGNFIKIL